MSEHFHLFSDQVRKNFTNMSNEQLFTIDADRDQVWNFYLQSFPLGTNDIFRERTEHDCSCCRHFIKNVATAVTINDDLSVNTVFDHCENLPEPYLTVATQMQEFIQSFSIVNYFLRTESQYGQETSVEVKPDGSTITWDHFSALIPSKFVQAGTHINVTLGSYDSQVSVYKRGLNELTSEAFEYVLDLIDQNQLYRGAEVKDRLKKFQEVKIKYHSGSLDSLQKNRYIWKTFNSSFATIRNSAIGTLLIDISEGMDKEVALKRYESVVAPHNYKRPKAAITAKMTEKAVQTIDELGLRNSLNRRHAVISDMSVNDVLWVDRSAESQMKDSLVELLAPDMKETTPDVSKYRTVDIGIEEFLENVAPNAKTVSALFEPEHESNLMSITTGDPSETDIPLFSWGSDFAWSYKGNITDSSVARRVKAAGGNVDNADLRISLSWFNSDDLDIQVREPNGDLIAYFNKKGKLDVDMNIGGENSVDPVENVSYSPSQHIADGTYSVGVNQYTLRNSHNVGFSIEIACNGMVSTLSYDKKVPTGKTIPVCFFKVKDRKIVEIKPTTDIRMTSGGVSREIYGILTNSVVPVQFIMKSPNFWDGSTMSGNEHTFFILEGCAADEPVRGIYNEFLHPKLHDHRKVFEVLGSRTTVPVVKADKQLSGIGFSSTKKSTVKLIVSNGTSTNVYNVAF